LKVGGESRPDVQRDDARDIGKDWRQVPTGHVTPIAAARNRPNKPPEPS
jgi:hypothetical protein